MAVPRFAAYGALSALTWQLVSSTPLPQAPSRIIERDAAGPWFTDFPDPGLIEVDGTFYAFATNSGPHIPTAASNDIGSGWAYYPDDTNHDSFPNLPSWYPANFEQVWAPDVTQMSNGQYNMLFAGPNADSPNPASPDDQSTNFYCLGIAYSDNPYGPFAPTDAPIKCDDPGQGVIDPSHFTDSDGTLYYLWRRASRAAVFIQQFDTDTGATALGDMTMLIEAPDDDLAHITEAPYMVLSSDGTYFLFYSTGIWNQPSYTVSYATCTSALGPCTEQGNLLQTGDTIIGGGTLTGPGGATLIPTGNQDEWYMAFHAITPGSDPTFRPLYTAIVSIQNGVPVVE